MFMIPFDSSEAGIVSQEIEVEKVGDFNLSLLTHGNGFIRCCYKHSDSVLSIGDSVVGFTDYPVVMSETDWLRLQYNRDSGDYEFKHTYSGGSDSISGNISLNGSSCFMATKTVNARIKQI